MITPTNRTRFIKHKTNKNKGLVIGIVAVLVVVSGLVVWFSGLLPLPQTPGSGFSANPDFSTNKMKDLWDNQDYRLVHEMCAKELESHPMESSAIMYMGLSSFYIALSLTGTDEKKAYLLQAAEYLRKIPIILSQRNNSDIEYVLGKTYYHLGYYYEDQAFDYLVLAEKDGYKSYDLFEYLGLLSSDFNEYAQALDYFKKSLQINDREIVYLALANTYDLMGNTDEALKVIDRLINGTKDQLVQEKALLKKGDILYRQGNLDGAQSVYKKVLELNAGSADAYFYLGEIESTRGDPIKARALWRQAYMIDSKHAGAINRLSS